nr:hypothetical protein [Cyanobium sp. Candia 9D4]
MFRNDSGSTPHACERQSDVKGFRRQKGFIEVLIENCSREQWPIGERKADKDLMTQNVHPLHTSGEVDTLEKTIIADIEENVVIGLNVKRSPSNNASAGPADVAQGNESCAPGGQMEARGNP